MSCPARSPHISLVRPPPRPSRPRRAGALWLAACLALAPALAAAQDDPDDDGLIIEDDDEILMEGDEEAEGDEDEEEEVIEFGADRVGRPGEVPTGATENPTPPRPFDEPVAIEADEGPARPVGYPVEVALRPLTLLGGMAEVGVDAPLFLSPAAVTTALRARYGIIDEVEVGLRYGIVGVDEDVTETGRAMAVEAQARLTDWASVQLAVPIMLDPFALGVTVGAPIKLHFGRSFALFFGRDLVSVKVAKFLPVVVDPRVDAASAEVDQGSNTIVSRGDLRFVGGAIYQLAPNLALTGDFGVIAPDFSGESAQVPLGATATWSPFPFVDLAGRLGFGDLGDSATFGLTAALAVRL